jgi:hypothetical protein
MKKLVMVCALVLVLTTVLSVSVALAAGGGKWVTAQQAPFYKVYGCSSNVVSFDLAGGKVMLVDPMGDVSLVVQGNVRSLDPNAGYDVWIRDMTGYTGSYLAKYEPLGYYKLTTFTTDGEGNGSFHLNLRAEDLPNGTYSIQVAINPFNVQGCTVIATQYPGMSVTVKTQ